MTSKLNIFVFKLIDFIPCLIARNGILIIEGLGSGSYFQLPTKDTVYNIRYWFFTVLISQLIVCMVASSTKFNNSEAMTCVSIPKK